MLPTESLRSAASLFSLPDQPMSWHARCCELEAFIEIPVPILGGHYGFFATMGSVS